MEQDCAYHDADGRDLEAGALQLWVEEDGEVVACARLLREPAGDRVGRVATAGRYRGRGYGAAIVRHAMSLARPPVWISAQAHLRAWYEALGFVVAGDGYLEDGMPHLPMRAG